MTPSATPPRRPAGAGASLPLTLGFLFVALYGSFVPGPAARAGRLGRDVVLLHQPGHGVDAAVVSAGHQLSVDARAAVARLELGVDGADRHEQGVASLLAGALGAVAPGVVA